MLRRLPRSGWRVPGAAIGPCYSCSVAGHLSNRFHRVSVETARFTQNGTACELYLETLALKRHPLLQRGVPSPRAVPGTSPAAGSTVTNVFQTHVIFCLKTGCKPRCRFLCVQNCLLALTWASLQFLVTQRAASFTGRIHRNAALLRRSSWRTQINQESSSQAVSCYHESL